MTEDRNKSTGSADAAEPHVTGGTVDRVPSFSDLSELFRYLGAQRELSPEFESVWSSPRIQDLIQRLSSWLTDHPGEAELLLTDPRAVIRTVAPEMVDIIPTAMRSEPNLAQPTLGNITLKIRGAPREQIPENLVAAFADSLKRLRAAGYSVTIRRT